MLSLVKDNPRYYYPFSSQQIDLVFFLSRKFPFNAIALFGRKIKLKIELCFPDSEKTWFEWLIPNLFWWMVNAAVVAMVLARIMVFGEPVTKPLSESSVCYWRNRKQAALALANVSFPPVFGTPPPLHMGLPPSRPPLTPSV